MQLLHMQNFIFSVLLLVSILFKKIKKLSPYLMNLSRGSNALNSAFVHLFRRPCMIAVRSQRSAPLVIANWQRLTQPGYTNVHRLTQPGYTNVHRLCFIRKKTDTNSSYNGLYVQFTVCLNKHANIKIQPKQRSLTLEI